MNAAPKADTFWQEQAAVEQAANAALRAENARLRAALTLAVHQHDNLVGAARAAASDKLYGPQGIARFALKGAD